MKRETLVILGAGYTASFILPFAAETYRQVLLTSREPDDNLIAYSSAQRLRFDLSDPATWTDIPSGDVLWCFPAAPLESVIKCAATLHIADRRVVVLGSTSAYDAAAPQTYPPPWIDETAPIDLTKPRVQGEEFLRNACGAIALRVAGIYGPGRNPIEWLKTGRVQPSPKYVNLIHVEDLAGVCIAALERGLCGEVYNVSDGTPRTWHDIALAMQFHYAIESPPPSIQIDMGKRIANRKLIEQLSYSLRHPNLILS